MQDYVLMTDSNSDIPWSFLEKHNLSIVHMPYSIEGTEYFDDSGRSGQQKAFFDAMRSGVLPMTSQLPMGAHMEYQEPIFQSGKDILFLTYSHNLSTNINNIKAARDELLQKYPQRKMIVVDSLSISFPQSILFAKAYELYENGMPMEELARWLEENKLKTQAYFTVSDLVYLKRGGRISAAAATVGTMLELKPIITENKEGFLQSIEKVKGRKKALKTLVELAANEIENCREAYPVVGHADAPDDAELLKKMLQERLPDLPEIQIWNVGYVIGSHCGPGTVAVSFFGKERPY